MTRTPVRKCSPTRPRIIGECRPDFSGRFGDVTSGPAPSTGSPMALTTRPSQPSSGRACTGPLCSTMSLIDRECALSQGAMRTRSGSIWTISPRAGCACSPMVTKSPKAEWAVMPSGNDDIGIDRGHRASAHQWLRYDIRRLNCMPQTYERVHARQPLWKALMSCSTDCSDVSIRDAACSKERCTSISRVTSCSALTLDCSTYP